MYRAQLENNSITSNQDQILQYQSRYFRKLYSSNKRILFELENKSNKKVSDNCKRLLDENLTIQDLADAFKQMNNNKSPGLDGLTIEVYKMFWSQIGETYYNAMIYAKEKGILQMSIRRGVISLIPKRDRDQLKIENWRPITLLTCDYKILAKAFANKMRPALEEIIDPDPTGFMRNRNISDNIRKIMEVVNYAHNMQIEAVIVSLDYQKCFDYLEHSAILEALKYYGFGEKFISWIKLLLNDVELCTLNNGYMSQFSKISRSVLQGSTTAASLFLVCGQILHDLIISNKEIKGTTIHGKEITISQFADDTTLFLMFNEKVLKAVVETLDIVFYNTGLIVNYDKTNIYRIGSLAHSNARFYTTRNFEWTNEPIKMLGIYVPTIPNLADTIFLNYGPTAEKMTDVIDRWSVRKVTLFGKVILVNSLIASLYVYKMQVLPNMENSQIKAIERTISAFIWNEKRPKISMSILQKDKTQGGLRLVNFTARQQAIKIQWITKIVNVPFWAAVFYGNVRYNIAELIWKCNLHYTHSAQVFKSDTDIFWIQVLEAWCHCNFTPIVEKELILEQCLWLNSHILSQDRPFLIQRMFDKNIIFIRDIVNVNGRLKTYEEIVLQYGECVTWLQYGQLISAIPSDWKQNIVYDVGYSLSLFDRFSTFIKISNLAYTMLIKDEKALTKRKQRWERKLCITMNNEDFLKNFKNIYAQTICTKFRDFQYRLLCGIIPTNRLLFLWRLTDSDMCSFCEHETEDEIHLFSDCVKIQNLWNSIKNFIVNNERNNVSQELVWSSKNIIFSTVHPRADNVINFIVTITKQYIFRVRCTKSVLNYQHLEDYIEQIYQLENNIAIHKRKWKRHVQKWSCLKEIVDNETEDFVNQYISDM